MNKSTFLNEHGDLLFDFSKMDYCIQYHDFISQLNQQHFCDVDFIAKSGDNLYLIETKKSSKTDKTRAEFCSWMARKYKDSLLLHWAYNDENESQNLVYLLLFESDRDDKKSRKKLRNEIKDYLPMKLTKEGTNKIISHFAVLNIDEFRTYYPDISVTTAADCEISVR